MAPEVSCPTALRLPGLGYMGLREAPVGRIRRSRHPAQRRNGTGGVLPAALRLPGLGYMCLRVPEIMLLVCNSINPGKAFVACDFSAHCAPG